MITGLIGKKLGMTRIFDRDGNVVPVTLLEVGPCTVIQVKNKSGADGYNAVQLGFQPAKPERVNKPMTGHFKKAGLKTAFKTLAEFRADKVDDLKVGDEITADGIFKENTKVKVIGTSIGKGFAGAMKKHHFHGSPDSHGAEKVHRRPMSAGATDAQRVFKGKRSPGHMGNISVTVRNLLIVRMKPFGEEIHPEEQPAKDAPASAGQPETEEKAVGKDAEKKEKKKEAASAARKYIVAVKGAVPGKPNALVRIENI